jgi:hypothetical protein
VVSLNPVSNTLKDTLDILPSFREAPTADIRKKRSIMNELTLNGQFLECLTDKQKGLLWEYYRLLKSPSTSIDDEVEQIAQIWSKAEEDTVLCKWLELIDCFYTDISEVDEKADNDKRAYLSEHLERLLEERANPIPTGKEDGFIQLDEEFWVFVCPNHSGYVRIPIQDKMTIAALNFQITK